MDPFSPPETFGRENPLQVISVIDLKARRN
jgi:hypothetical protein